MQSQKIWAEIIIKTVLSSNKMSKYTINSIETTKIIFIKHMFVTLNI